MKTTWPVGGSAGSEASAGGCCLASTDTGSFSGRSKQLEKAWTAQRTSSGSFFQQQTGKVVDVKGKEYCQHTTDNRNESVWITCGF